MAEQVNVIQHSYSNSLTTLTDINKRLKQQAKNYFERYKELKHQFKKDREDYHMKSQILEHEVKTNLLENIKLQNGFQEVQNEMNFFKDKTGITLESDAGNGIYYIIFI